MTGRLASVLRPVPITLLCAVAIVGVLAVGAASASAAPFAYDAAASEELSNTVPGGAFGEPFGLTFDAAGNLFVTDQTGNGGTGVVDKFDSENVFQAQLGGSTFTNPGLRGIAVNNETGHVYVGDGEFLTEPFFGSIYAMDAGGTELSRWLGANTTTGTFGEHFVQVAVDNSPGASHGDVYAMFGNSEGGEVDVLEPQNDDAEEGKLVGSLAVPGGFKFNGREGIAVDQSTGQVYVADQGNHAVDRFGPEGTLEATIELPERGDVKQSPLAVAIDATNGHLFVLGSYGRYEVLEYDESGQILRQITGTGPNEPLVEPTGVAVQESGPRAGALYLVDSGAKKIDVFVELPPAAPLIESEGVSLKGAIATLYGEIDPRGAATGYRFEFGACATPITCAARPFERVVPVPDGSLGFEDFNAHAVAPVVVQGLSEDTVYHFRLVAHNAHGEVFGQERTFTTQAPNPFALPDHRQWQLVSPADKSSATVGEGGQTGIVKASADGASVTYLANAPNRSSAGGRRRPDPGSLRSAGRRLELP
jgi:DNA-binding beta-propeller fold protein YncE